MRDLHLRAICGAHTKKSCKHVIDAVLRCNVNSDGGNQCRYCSIDVTLAILLLSNTFNNFALYTQVLTQKWAKYYRPNEIRNFHIC